jgi:hypothetical protein
MDAYKPLCLTGSKLRLGVAMQSLVQGTSVESNDISNRGDKGGIDLPLRIPIA